MTTVSKLDLIIHVPAIKPLYGTSYRRYAYIEIGHMISLLQRQAQKIGLNLKIDVIDQQMSQDDILAVSIHFVSHSEDFQKKIRINYLYKDGDVFKNKDTVIAQNDYSVFTRAGEWNLLLSNGAAIVCVEGTDSPDNWIAAGIALQEISENLYTKNLGSCMLGPVLYVGSIYSMVIGQISEADKLKAEDNAENVPYEDIINEELSKNLPEYMIPHSYMLLNEFPLSANGKLDLKRLPKFSIVSSHKYVAPRNEIEEKLCRIWQEVLHQEKVGINDNFFKIGGHSLLATRLISKVRSEFGAEVPLKSLFEHPTIANFAANLRNYELKADIPLLIVQKKPEKIPLSFAQQRLWIIDKLLPEKALYNIPYAMKLSGDLDYSKFEAAINTLIKRHESFRTNFCETSNGEAYQVIAAAWDVKLEVENISEDKVEVKAKKEAETPFDFSKDHLLRVRLLKIAKNEHVLLITMHHIISDGWSMPIFLGELAKLYNGETDLPELSITYADYAIWQRSWLKDEALDKQLSYWKNYLNDIPEQIDLSYDHQRPAEMNYAGGRINSNIGRDVYQQLIELANNTNTTMFMVMFAAVSCLLHRYSRQEDVVIGTPIANRHYKETEGLIGFFVNTLALKTHFQKGYTFKEILKNVKRSVLDGYENQDVPFEYLVDKLNVERRLNVNPLFQVMVVVNKTEKQEEFSGLKANDLAEEYAISKFDLTFSATELEEDIAVSIEYSTELFEKETIENLVEHLRIFLEEVSKNSDVAVDGIELLTEEEKNQQLVEWNNTTVDYPKNECIHELFEKQVEKSPEAIAVVFENKHLTYSELDARSNQLARYLRKQGIKADDLVGICIERSLEMIIGILDCVVMRYNLR